MERSSQLHTERLVEAGQLDPGLGAREGIGKLELALVGDVVEDHPGEVGVFRDLPLLLAVHRLVALGVLRLLAEGHGGADDGGDRQQDPQSRS